MDLIKSEPGLILWTVLMLLLVVVLIYLAFMGIKVLIKLSKYLDLKLKEIGNK